MTVPATPADPAAATSRRFAWFMVIAPALGTAAALTLLLLRGSVAPATPLLVGLFYLFSAIGVEVGFHRYFSHRAFKCRPALRLFMGLCGSAAGQGPVLYWAAVHRDHHRFSDTARDPHTPSLGGWKGFWRAHIGWLFEAHAIDIPRLTPDLIKDPTTIAVQRSYIPAFAVGLTLPALVGGFISGPMGALEGFLWGGWVRIFVNHHVTWSINSLCHQVGSRPFATRDTSHNLAWLALPSLGGAWHNNHHAFPRSATNDFSWWQIDPSAWLIRAAVACGLVWDVCGGPGQRIPARSSTDGGH